LLVEIVDLQKWGKPTLPPAVNPRRDS
jgi:hypothetical protein